MLLLYVHQLLMDSVVSLGMVFKYMYMYVDKAATVINFSFHFTGISCIQFDDTRIVSGSWDKTIKVRKYVKILKKLQKHLYHCVLGRNA